MFLSFLAFPIVNFLTRSPVPFFISGLPLYVLTSVFGHVSPRRMNLEMLDPATLGNCFGHVMRPFTAGGVTPAVVEMEELLGYDGKGRYYL